MREASFGIVSEDENVTGGLGAGGAVDWRLLLEDMVLWEDSSGWWYRQGGDIVIHTLTVIVDQINV